MDKVTELLYGATKKVEESIKKLACELHDVHANQKYDGYLPYSFHLNLVGKFVEEFMPKDIDEDTRLGLIAAAYLHDSIEDARVHYHDIVKLLSDEFDWVADIVYACTAEKGKTRAERYNDKYYEGIRNTKWASFIKSCDRLANIFYSSQISTRTSLLEMYKKEHQHFCDSVDVPEEIKIRMAQYLGL